MAQITDTPWLELAKLNQDSRFNRRGFEWKLAIEFWGFVVGIPLLARQLGISCDALHGIRCQVTWWYVLAGLSFIVSAYATHRAHATDLEYIRFYTKRAIGEDARSPDAQPCCFLTTNGALWIISKLLFTIALLWASCGILLLVDSNS